MKMSEALIAWTSNGECKVGRLLREGERDWTDGYEMTGGAAYTRVRRMEGEAAKAQAFIEWHTLVLRDGVDPKQAHEEFLQIDEYRDGLADEMLPLKYFRQRLEEEANA